MDDVEVIRTIYERFNARDIDGVLSALADDVAWANGMEGGHVRGREAVRAYWTRQWAIVSPRVDPVGFRAVDGGVVVEVRQSVRAADGRSAPDPSQGLRDATLRHVFRLRDGLVTRFDVAGEAGRPEPADLTS